MCGGDSVRGLVRFMDAQAEGPGGYGDLVKDQYVEYQWYRVFRPLSPSMQYLYFLNIISMLLALENSGPRSAIISFSRGKKYSPLH